MAFTSAAFLLFLTVLFAVYYFVPHAWRWVLLLVGSLVFYAYSGFMPYICITVVSTYLFGWLIGKKRSKILVTVYLFINLGLLALVKMPSFGLLMPLGISFYTFQSVGYILDVYRGKTYVERNLARLALFVSFFPQVIQGPISRHGNLARTLYEPQPFCMDNISMGLRRILWGFFKKLVIADRLLVSVKLMSGDTDTFSGWYVWLNIFVYAIVLYADFTGGIDITIGIARFFGITVTENFNKPFYARNIAEYWRRWHITMGTWFRDYLFYPMSVSGPMRRFSKISRKHLGNGFGKRLPVYITTLVTWFATGIWHGTGANFIAWGLTNGFVIILSQECTPLYASFHKRFAFSNTKQYEAFTIVRTFCLMCIIRSFDIYRDVGLTFRMFVSSLTPWKAPGLVSIGVDTADIIIVLLGVVLLIVAGRAAPRDWFESRPVAVKFSLCLALFVVILVFGVYGYGYNANQFIYNQF